jgi:hypothetical protein
VLARLRNKNLHTWVGGYARDLARRVGRRNRPGHRHLLFALCDHYEPLWGKATPHEVGDQRVKAWQDGYPRLASEFRDADGRPPRHSFFFPGEEYHPSYLDRLAELCGAGFGEVEVHLHHDGDTADKLRADLHDYLDKFAAHGHISRGPDGRHRFAFIHGNWCLANARPDGRWCGVDEELQLLFDAGCFADFTFPSAPDVCQPDLVNQIYWPTGDLRRRKAYATGERARVGERKDDRLLMITGPLALTRRAGRLAVRIESSALADDDPPDTARLRSWVAQDIHVDGRPEWVFVKLHTHGAPEGNAACLLGEPGRRLHQALAAEFNDGERWSLHYVTAREMYNVALAAMDGRRGDPADFFDYEVAPPPVARREA